MDEQFLKLNVRGRSFMIKRELLSKYPKSKLALLNPNDPCYIKETREYFLDVNPSHINVILDLYRAGYDKNLSFGRGMSTLAIKEELEYWRFDSGVLSPHEAQRCLSELSILSSLTHLHPPGVVPAGRRGVLYEFLEMPTTSCAAVMYAVFYHLVIATSIIVFMVETKPRFKHYKTEDYFVTMETINETAPERNTTPLIVIQIIITLLLLVEYGMRFFVSPNKWDFCKDVYNITDALGTVPDFFLRIAQFIVIFPPNHSLLSLVQLFLLSRSFRFVRLISNFRAARLILSTATSSITQLFSWLVCSLVALIIFSNLFYFAEQKSEYNWIENSFVGMWWAVVTLTTVGYGDIYPTATGSKVVASACMLFGVLSFAMIAAIFSSNLRRVYKLSVAIPACNDSEIREFHLKIAEYIKLVKTRGGKMSTRRENVV